MKLSSSSKASEKALGMVFGVITFLLILAIVVFVFIPKITKPLGVDPCLQQGGVRALSCDDDVAMRNNFIEPDKQNNICCMALPGQQAEFKTWASALSNADKNSSTRSVVRIDDIRNLYLQATGKGIYLFLHDVDKPSDSKRIFHQNTINNIPQLDASTQSFPVTPGDTRVVAGVNKFGDGRCILTIYQAAVIEGTPLRYTPKGTQEGIAQHAIQGYYDNKDCKNNTAVQLTFKLQGLPEPHPFYIVAYTVDTTSGKMTAYALLNTSIKTTTSGGTPGGTPENSTTGETPNLPLLPPCEAQSCETYRDPTTCVQHTASFPTDLTDSRKICSGCHWERLSAFNKKCITCLIDSCSGYTTQESCNADPCYAESSICVWLKGSCASCDSLSCESFTTEDSCRTANPCGNDVCVWSDKTCFECKDISTCNDYPDKPSCNTNQCLLSHQGTLQNCNWKVNVFNKNICETSNN